MPLEFELDARTFDLDNAYYLARACLLATGDSSQLAAQAKEQLALEEETVSPFDVVDEGDIADYHGFTGCNEHLALVAIRDADSLDPWLTDAAMVQKPAFGGLVHKGFMDAFEAVWEPVESFAKEHSSEDRQLWLTGHGLGGALAILAAARLDNQGKNVRAVYTFGAPRVGDSDFYARFPAPAYRLVNNNDVIAHLPPACFPVGGYHWISYKHVGSLVYFDRHGNIGEGTTNWERKKELVQSQLLRDGQPPTHWFQDHQMSNYVEALEKNL